MNSHQLRHGVPVSLGAHAALKKLAQQNNISISDALGAMVYFADLENKEVEPAKIVCKLKPLTKKEQA